MRELEDAGIDVTIGHDAATIDRVSAEVVVTSSAIPETNPEVVRARKLGIPIWPRAKMLSYLLKQRHYRGRCRSRGKTTTSSMIATMLDRLGWDPSFLIGGVVEGYDTNGRNGEGGYFVCEADESDGSFLYLNPDVVVVTNIEADHLDHYGTLENIEKTFCTFMGLVGEKGTVVVNGDNPHYVELARSTGRHVVTYGFDKGNDYVCTPEEGLAPHRLAMRFSVKTPAGASVDVTIKSNPGRHNMANATAAIAVADVLGADVSQAAEKLSEFKGARRRFTHVGDIDGVTVVDDYGHHPPRLPPRSTLHSQLGFDRIVCVFQPHRYSRTKALERLFAHAFDKVDVLRVMDVFSAGEMPIPGISGKTVSSRSRLRARWPTWPTSPTVTSSSRTSATPAVRATCSLRRAQATSPRLALRSSPPCASVTRRETSSRRERLQRIHEPVGSHRRGRNPRRAAIAPHDVPYWRPSRALACAQIPLRPCSRPSRSCARSAFPGWSWGRAPTSSPQTLVTTAASSRSAASSRA